MFDYGFNNFQKVEVPGGAVTIPEDVQVSDLTNTDNSYYYGTDYCVGSGSEEVQAEEPSVIAAEETTPTPVTPESADSNTGQDEKTQTVYRYVIYILAGLIAVTLVVTIVSGIRKHMKKKEGRNPDGFSFFFLNLFKHQEPMHRNHLHNKNRYGCWLP